MDFLHMSFAPKSVAGLPPAPHKIMCSFTYLNKFLRSFFEKNIRNINVLALSYYFDTITIAPSQSAWLTAFYLIFSMLFWLFDTDLYTI